MEIAKQEVVAIAKALNESRDARVKELDELELVMIGGGQGDVSLG